MVLMLTVTTCMAIVDAACSHAHSDYMHGSVGDILRVKQCGRWVTGVTASSMSAGRIAVDR